MLQARNNDNNIVHCCTQSSDSETVNVDNRQRSTTQKKDAYKDEGGQAEVPD